MLQFSLSSLICLPKKLIMGQYPKLHLQQVQTVKISIPLAIEHIRNRDLDERNSGETYDVSSTFKTQSEDSILK